MEPLVMEKILIFVEYENNKTVAQFVKNAF
jgi:hypothetical protein